MSRAKGCPDGMKACLSYNSQGGHCNHPSRCPCAARRFHFTVRRGTSSTDGRPVLAFGFRVGYWPCLMAPFIEVACGPYRIDLWHGLPSYRGATYRGQTAEEAWQQLEREYAARPADPCTCRLRCTDTPEETGGTCKGLPQ